MRISAYSRLTRTQKTSAVGLAAAAGVVALTAGAAPGSAGGGSQGQAKPVASHSASAAHGKQSAQAPVGDHAGSTKTTAAKTVGQSKAKSESAQLTGDGQNRHAAGKSKTDDKVKAVQADKAEEARKGETADRSTRATKGDNLDGWIKQARSIMKEEGIPGSYHGIKKNIMRESGGDPQAMNDWDVNAQKGTPSKGLLQTIQPTFDQYHVKGTTHKVTDPVANIVAACNYAADKYGSMDNVNSAY
ncbi:transglycosylase SLT domain-containing protein [Streptomyces albidus (ex Kaewkla and Franco 2022)]|uniref:transglycosylase SLT domain-containing protein n=1 Tax=Streptomyces albidus (ex Kaewkla and Franco 2022) TaxID=722709 RepID=UPI0015EEC2DD|nr:transglycosylase SLT domain-containing protein [Streptomyces albidus (ex Kaewkla and Franco 2022)]